MRCKYWTVKGDKRKMPLATCHPRAMTFAGKSSRAAKARPTNECRYSSHCNAHSHTQLYIMSGFGGVFNKVKNQVGAAGQQARGMLQVGPPPTSSRSWVERHRPVCTFAALVFMSCLLIARMARLEQRLVARRSCRVSHCLVNHKRPRGSCNLSSVGSLCLAHLKCD